MIKLNRLQFFAASSWEVQKGKEASCEERRIYIAQVAI